MSQALTLQTLFNERRLWRGNSTPAARGTQPTGYDWLDAALPTRGWPEAALTEILFPADGVGELRLVLPTLARLTQTRQAVVLIAPPYIPFAPAWQARGVDLAYLHIVEARPREVGWAMEQCLRAGCCAAVLGWPAHADERMLRRLQLAASSGQALGFLFRDRQHLANASPAALRIEIESSPSRLRVRKCRGGNVPAPIPIPVLLR